MQKLTVVLTHDGPINLGAWQNELVEAGFDLILDPTRPQYDDPNSVPVVVCGHDAVIEFMLARASEPAPWFPVGRIQIREYKWVALFEWREGEPYEHAAALASAAALAKVYQGALFDADGLNLQTSAAAYREARTLFDRLPR